MVTEALSGARALDMLRLGTKVDVVVTDHAMPGMTRQLSSPVRSGSTGRNCQSSWRPVMPNCRTVRIRACRGCPSHICRRNWSTQIAKVLSGGTDQRHPAGCRAHRFIRNGLAKTSAHSARLRRIMEMSLDLLGNAVVSGLLLGGFYAAVTIGVSISFGMLDIVNIAHPAFIILGSYIAYIANTMFGMDPILASVIALPAFYLLGAAVYQVYYVAFERRGEEALRGLAFFFGLLFITEVMLVLGLRRGLPPGRRAIYRTEPASSAPSICRCACWCRAWSRW